MIDSELAFVVLKGKCEKMVQTWMGGIEGPIGTLRPVGATMDQLAPVW